MNFYEVLEIDRNATTKEVRKAYHRLAKELHPDRRECTQAHDQRQNQTFQEIHDAYAILSDENKRKEYDISIDYDTRFSGFFVDIDKILQEMNMPQPVPGGFDNHTGDEIPKVEVDEQQFMYGCSRTVYLRNRETCQLCAGHGISDYHNNTMRCNHCYGTGMHLIFPCGRCLGRGRIILNNVMCETCSGNGEVVKESVVELDIPAHVKDVEVIFIEDVRVQTKHVFADGVYADENGNLVKKQQVSVIEWLCGFEKKIEFGPIHTSVKTDGVFDLSQQVRVRDKLLVRFNLSLDNYQLKKLKKFTRIFKELFKSKRRKADSDNS